MKSRRMAGTSHLSLVRILRSATLTVAVLILFVGLVLAALFLLVLAALAALLSLSRLAGLTALLALLTGLTALLALSELIAFLLHIVCHMNHSPNKSLT